MPWFRIDDDAHHHPKVLKARNEGFGAFARMGSWSMHYLTDGHIPEDVALEIAGGKAKLLKIVGAGFLEVAEGGYQIHDHLDRNPSAEEIKEVAAARSAAGKAGGKQSGASRRNKNEANREANASAKEKQTGINPPANREPIPIPIPGASDEAPQEHTLSRAYTAEEYQLVQRQWDAAWEKADLPGHPLLVSVIAEWIRTSEKQRPTPERACEAYKAIVDEQRTDGFRPHPGGEHMLRCWGTVVDMARGQMPTERPPAAGRSADPRRGQVPVASGLTFKRGAK